MESAPLNINVVDDGDGSLIDDEIALRQHMQRVLRPSDEAIMLPGATRSDASSAFKNIVFTIDGSARNAPARMFSAEWGHGVSIVRIPTEAAERVLSSEHRATFLSALRDEIPNELTDRLEDGKNIVIGPRLESGPNNRDMDDDDWVEGFDGSNCAAGLYSAVEHRPPDGTGNEGMTRAHRSYFLVAKAGAGIAAQQFHQRMQGLLGSGRSLSDVMDTELNDAVMERVVSAGRRNRARIILRMANVLGLGADVDSVPDHAATDAFGSRPLAILMADSVTNVLERIMTTKFASDASEWRYHANTVSTAASQGIVVCSNVSDGFVMLYSRETGNEATIRVLNPAHGAIPFGSKRISTAFDALRYAVATHSKNGDHPDSEWIQQRFGWKTATLRRVATLDASAPQLSKQMAPCALWGTHAPLNISAWPRAIGIHAMQKAVLSPELVALAGTEPLSLRSAISQIGK